VIARRPRTRTSFGAPDETDAVQRIVVLSSTFRDASVTARASAESVLRGIAPTLAESVLLTTCHRAELIGVEDTPLRPVPGVVRTVRGAYAVERVLSVIAGFDSAIVAEEQLLGQARDAYATALARRDTGPILNELMRRALRLGKRVRASARPGTDRSLADAAARLVLERTRRAHDARPILVIGTGKVGQQAAARLADRGATVTVASRDPARAERVVDALPRRSQHTASTVADALAHAADFGALLIAVRGSVPLGPQHIETARLLVDLSTPAAVDDGVTTALGDRSVTIDSIVPSDHRRLEPRIEARLRAEIIEERDRFIGWLGERRSGDAVGMLRRSAAETRRRHLDRLRRRGLLDPRQLAAVEAATEALVGELLHGPTLALRAGGATAADVRRIFGVDT
jgi:glutamyl-tRNA reductase